MFPDHQLPREPSGIGSYRKRRALLSEGAGFGAFAADAIGQWRSARNDGDRDGLWLDALVMDKREFQLAGRQLGRRIELGGKGDVASSALGVVGVLDYLMETSRPVVQA